VYKVYSEPSSAEADVDVWCQAFLEVNARKEEKKSTCTKFCSIQFILVKMVPKSANLCPKASSIPVTDIRCNEKC